MAWRSWLRRGGRGQRGWSVTEFVIAGGLFALVGTAVAMMYASSQQSMTRTLQFLNAADQVGEISRALDRAFSVAGMGAPTLYPSPSATPAPKADATFLLADATAITFLSELDKDPTFLSADYNPSTDGPTVNVNSVSGLQGGDMVLLFDRFSTAEATVASVDAGTNQITLRAALAISLKAGSQVSRPRRVTFSVVTDPGSGVTKITRTVRKYEDASIKVQEDQDFARGIASATFSYFDNAGQCIPGPGPDAQGNCARGNVVATPDRLRIRQIVCNVRWPVDEQVKNRYGGTGQYTMQIGITPWNLKQDRKN